MPGTLPSAEDLAVSKTGETFFPPGAYILGGKGNSSGEK